MQSNIAKLFDGLFLGDQTAARDEDFLLLNHIRLVVNLTNGTLPNYFQHYHIKYLEADWKQLDQQWPYLCRDITRTLTEGEAVLVHSHDDLEGPLLLAGIFLIARFRWSLYKTLQYLHDRLKLPLSPPSYTLLTQVELRLLDQEGKLSYNWEQRPQDAFQLIIRNTFLNSSDKRDQKKTINKTSARKPKNINRKVSFYVQPAIKITYNQSQPTSKETHTHQSHLRNRIIQSVRKMLTEGCQNRRPTPDSTLQDTRMLNSSLKKQKSSYTLASIHSLIKPNQFLTASSLQSPEERAKTPSKVQRLQTQQNETNRGMKDIYFRDTKTEEKARIDKITLEAKVPSDVNITKGRFKSCKSLTLMGKQNLKNRGELLQRIISAKLGQ